MEKLLHERLREAASWYQLFDPIEVTGASFRVLFNKLADEIERYYIPRPRFEDGEPIGHNDHWNVQWESEFCYKHATYRINALSETGQPLSIDYTNGKINSKAVMEDGFVVRRQPKVLDADGVEIKVGDTVWLIDSDDCFTVRKLCDEHCVVVEADDEIGHHYRDSMLTHKEPDSLERIKADRELTICEYSEKYGGSKSQDIDLLDRAIALIERGA